VRATESSGERSGERSGESAWRARQLSQPELWSATDSSRSSPMSTRSYATVLEPIRPEIDEATSSTSKPARSRRFVRLPGLAWPSFAPGHCRTGAGSSST